ncbi:hypothetical protein OIU77_003611 [Salix suchowensis]|uniref:Uncharacterized protein n=2 Tax=Salix TaxID=40685 RepID=A0A9Q0ZFK9_9ROSI|nr:hypothetical protein OIU77_003611 [Salix suchowensis]KAJ6732720.1 hypothetical protein OIU74_004632 [Salix koriyanagi]
MSGNPVFHVDDEQVCVLSFDVTRFFQQVDFLQMGSPTRLSRTENVSMNVPAWAATEARRIEFWTEVAERGRRVVARGETPGWWNDGGDLDHLELRECLEEVFRRLRDGGWREEEVREMMDGCDQGTGENGGACEATEFDEEDVFWHGRMWSIVLLRAGRSMEDVVRLLDLEEFQLPNSCSRVDDDHKKSRIEQLMKLRSLEV